MSETKVEHRRTYAEMTVDSPNPLARYSHRARILRSINTIKRHLDPKGVFVDFGAGTGLLLYTVRQLFPGAELIGVEPHLECLFPGSARYVPSLSDLPDCSVDVIGGFEVCEHLYAHELRDFLGDCRRILRPEGHLILSVPIMHGLTVGLKIINHLRNGGSSSYRFLDVCRATFGLSVTPDPDPRGSHKGFDFRRFSKTVEGLFKVESRFFSPLESAPWFLNSQVFLICVPIAIGEA
jgi:SAM-dependent methyltransferase